MRNLLIGASILLLACVLLFARHKSPQPIAVAPGTLSYLPLGDSYTIGESVSEQERWPNQLATKLGGKGIKLTIVQNPSVTGYTTQDLIDKELPLVAKLRPDFVTVLIGVNDYVQGVDAQTFTTNLTYIIDTLQKEMTHPSQLVLVTIPDYGKTPTGARFGAPAESAAGITNFNQIIETVAAAHKVPVANIFPVSQKVTNDPSLTASDGLHPSGAQYALWTDIIYQTIQDNHVIKL